MKWFAHPHDHDIRYFKFLAGEFPGIIQYLLNDFTGREISSKSHLSGGTKSTSHGATCLGGDTQRLTLFVVHQHGLDGDAIWKFEKGFYGFTIR